MRTSIVFFPLVSQERIKDISVMWYVVEKNLLVPAGHRKDPSVSRLTSRYEEQSIDWKGSGLPPSDPQVGVSDTGIRAMAIVFKPWNFLGLVRCSSGLQEELRAGIGWPASANVGKEEHLLLCISIVHQFFSVAAASAAVAKLSAKILAPEQAFHLLDAVSCQTQANRKELTLIKHHGEVQAPPQLI